MSMARPWCGIIGGFICRRRAHWVVRKKGWVLTSEAPAREPMRRSSSFISSLRIRDLQRLGDDVSGNTRDKERSRDLL